MAFLNWLDGVLWGLPLIVLMVVTGLYFTIGSGAFQFRHFGYILKRTGGTIFKKEERSGAADGKNEGMISSFQAICTAVGGTVGFGNIAGVATAVAAGGPGAIFWMWLTACLGLILKQVEVTLGVYYRRKKGDNKYYGGPTYYMETGLGKELHWGSLWKIPAIIFGIGIFSTYFVSSSNLTAAQIVAGSFNIPTIAGIDGVIIAGFVIMILAYLVSAGGTQGVAKIFSTLVPIMSVIYILMGIGMIIANIGAVPGAIGAIFTNAFTGTAAIGGFAGCAVSNMIRTGMARAVYSNEAGWGTSPFIHGSAKTPHPVEQGLWGSFEVFFDTFVVCSITGLSVILSGCWTDGTNGGTLALSAFSSSFGVVGSVLLAIIMIVFSVTTSGGWFTYYIAVLQHIWGNNDFENSLLYKIFYWCRALPAFLWTIYLVITNNQGFIWTVVDITSAIPTFINVAVILILSKQYFVLLKDYKARYMGKGTVDKKTKLFYED